MSMKVNEDGKFFGPVVAAFAGAVPVMILAGILWWSDARNADSNAAVSIARIEKRVDAVEEDQRKQRELAAADRQKLAELGATVRGMSETIDRIDRRIEALFSRLMSQPPPRSP